MNSLDMIEAKINSAIKKNEQEVLNTISMLSMGNIEDAIQKLYHSSKIYIFARGFSEMIAKEMAIKFQLTGKNCEMHKDPNIIKLISKRIKKTEIVIFVSLNGETEELVEACKNLKMRNVSTITLTAGIDSSLAELSEIVLLGYKGTQSFFPDFEVRSRLPLQVLARILLDAYGFGCYKRSELDRILQKNLIKPDLFSFCQMAGKRTELNIDCGVPADNSTKTTIFTKSKWS